jgi:hypothetical protein
MKAAAAAGSTAGLTTGSASAAAKKQFRFRINQDFIRIGMVGLGPYSHAMMYTEALNDPDVPPGTNLRVVAIWGREDGYVNSFRGSETWKEKRLKDLHNYMSIEKFTGTLGVQHVVKNPADMLKLVDAVFITDPEDSLNLARPFLEKGMPVFVNRPMAWTMHEAREIIRLAKEHGSTLIAGSCVPWIREIQVVKGRIDPGKVQHYYIEGSGANFCSYHPHIFETALNLVPGSVTRCSTFGWNAPPDEDPLDLPVLFTHIEYEKTSKDRDPILGLATNSYETPIRCWVKVHLDDTIIEQKVFWEGVVGGVEHDYHITMPFMHTISRAFMTGEWPEDEEHLLTKVAVMLMAHTSGIEKGRPVSRKEIEDHALPRFQTEKIV